MRITHEADYAIRIVFALMQAGDMAPAREIAEKAGVTQRFTLKILRKLAADGVVAAHKGADGGYYLADGWRELSLGRVIECIDGPLELNHCLSDDFPCTRVGDKSLCCFHRLFEDMNSRFRNELYAVRMADYINKQ